MVNEPLRSVRAASTQGQGRFTRSTLRKRLAPKRHISSELSLQRLQNLPQVLFKLIRRMDLRIGQVRRGDRFVETWDDLVLLRDCIPIRAPSASVNPTP